MENFLFALFSAFWLGILTSISPCPLASNIAAISFISRRVGKPSLVFWNGLVYTLGRTLTYLILGIILVAGLMNTPLVSAWLLKYMNKLLGPILILVGMFLLELLHWNWSGISISEKFQSKVENKGIWGAALLGMVFALTFCPISAALFFGSLFSLAVKHQSYILLPTIYGIGTGLPVLIFAIVIAFGAHSLGKTFDKVAQFELWARKITGLIFIGIGIYLTLAYIFNVFS